MQQGNEVPAAAPAAVYAVSLKLPEFWESSAAAWFVQAEAQFAVRNITADDTKYYYVVAALSSSTASRALSLLQAPPAEDKYNELKSHLLQVYELSDAERASRLFALHGLGDSKPSELMDRMLNLLGPHKPDFLFTHLFLKQLPPQIRAALASSDVKDCRRLAMEADRVMSAWGQSSSSSSSSYSAAALQPAHAFLSTGMEGQQCHNTPNTMGGQQCHVSSGLMTGDVMGIAAAAVPQRQRVTGLCFFHARFGNKARRCEPPCNFNKTGNARTGTR